MDILKNDVQAILGQIFEMKLKENKRFSTMTPGLDKKVQNFYIIYILNSCVHIWLERDTEGINRCQLSVIFAPVLGYRKCPISTKVGSKNCENVGRDMAGSIPG